jgi:hypothetical protein
MFQAKMTKGYFNVEEFIKGQEDIYNKFVPPTANNTPLEKFDKLLINLSEEMIETEWEYLRKGMSSKEFKEELVDVIMYTGTCIVCWKECLPEDEFNKIINSLIIEPMNYKNNLILNFSIHYFDSISVRRGFSERKWHKPLNPNEDKISTIKKLLGVQIKYLGLYISQLAFLLDGELESVSEMIREKQSFIYTL